MHIILGEENAQDLFDKYTLLELDLIQVEPNSDPLQAYCVLEHIPVDEIPKIEEYKHLHDKLIENYRKGDWNFCEQALEHLHDKWGTQLNSFYDEISTRIAKYKETEPGDNWDPVIHKY
jgi:hypothetical protein